MMVPHFKQFTQKILSNSLGCSLLLPFSVCSFFFSGFCLNLIAQKLSYSFFFFGFISLNRWVQKQGRIFSFVSLFLSLFFISLALCFSCTCKTLCISFTSRMRCRKGRWWKNDYMCGFTRIMLELYIYIGVCRVCMFNGVVSECLINEICKCMYKGVFKRKSIYFVGK